MMKKELNNIMNKEITLDNLECIRKHLGVSKAKFSIMFGNEKSYYSNMLKRNSIPSLCFIVKICTFQKLDLIKFLNEKLVSKIIFESEIQR